MNIDSCHQTTMHNEENSIQIVVMTHEAGRVTSHDTFFSKYGKRYFILPEIRTFVRKFFHSRIIYEIKVNSPVMRLPAIRCDTIR